MFLNTRMLLGPLCQHQLYLSAPKPKLLLFAINITKNKGKPFHRLFSGVVCGGFFYHKRDQMGESGLPVHTSLCLWKAYHA